MKPPKSRSSKSSRQLVTNRNLSKGPKLSLSSRQISDHSNGTSKSVTSTSGAITIATGLSMNNNGNDTTPKASHGRRNYTFNDGPKVVNVESSSTIHANMNIPHEYSNDESQPDINVDDARNISLERMDDNDPFGMHVTRLLNEGAFRDVLDQRRRQQEEVGIKPPSPWFPIFSSANWNRCMNVYQSCKHTLSFSPNSKFVYEGGKTMTMAESDSAANTSNFSKRLLDTCIFFCKLVFLVVIPIIVICTHVILCYLLKVYIFMMVTISSVFIDWKDVYEICPKSVQEFCYKVQGWIKYLDDKVLLAGRLKGRESWRNGRVYLHPQNQQQQLEGGGGLHYRDNDRVGTGGPSGMNGYQDIDWNRVHQAIEEGKFKNEKDHGVVSTSSSSSQSSTPLDRKTVDHLVAMNFVHVMMYNDHQQDIQASLKAAKKKSRRNIPLSSTGKNYKKSARRLDQKGGPRDREGVMTMSKGASYIIDSVMHDSSRTLRHTNGVAAGGRYDDALTNIDDDDMVLRTTGSGIHTMQSSEAIELIESADRTVQLRQATKRRNFLDTTDANAGLSFGDSEEFTASRSRMGTDFDEEDREEDDLSYASDDIEGYSADDPDSIITGISYSSSFANSTNLNRVRSKSEELQEMKNKKWLDVGAKIGIRILKSEKVQNAIAQTQNLSVDTTGNLTHDDIDTDHEHFHEPQNVMSPSSRQIAKPFHTMWSTTEDLNDTSQYLDNVSEGMYSVSDSDAPPNERNLSPSPGTPKSPFTRRISLSPGLLARRSISSSLSPPKKKRWKSATLPYSQSHSLPSSPMSQKRIVPNGDFRRHYSNGDLNFGGTSNASTSVTSSDAIQWVPREFDANRHLPESMAINQGVIGNSSKPKDARTIFAPASTCTTKKDLRRGLEFSKTESSQSGTVSRSGKSHRQRQPLLAGVKIIVPIVSLHDLHPTKSNRPPNPGRVGMYQSATVISSKRINLESSKEKSTFSLDKGAMVPTTNALSIEVYLDKCFLRNSSFAKMTIRIPDSHRHFLRHSKYPIGTAVATSYGIGVFVGWRPNDDCHIVRSLWQKRGQGSSHAYLNRNALHGIMEASVGFRVTTSQGSGKVVGYVDGGKYFKNGKYLVQMRRQGRSGSKDISCVRRSDILQCKSTKFIPVIEQLKEAAKYQMQKDNYEAEKLQLMFEEKALMIDSTWRVFSEGFELFLTSFIKAAEEDENFDSEISTLLSAAIGFLEDFDLGDKSVRRKQESATKASPKASKKKPETPKQPTDNSDSGTWLMKSLFGDVVKTPELKTSRSYASSKLSLSFSSVSEVSTKPFGQKSYAKIYAILKTLMRTIAIAKAGCSNKPNLKMALAIIHETLLFIHNVIKVQQRNMTRTSIEAWIKTLEEFADVFGPTNARLEKIGNGILERLQEHGKLAKLRAKSFADLLIADDNLIESLEKGDLRDCMTRVENAAVTAKILNEEMREQYHKLCVLIYNTMAPRASQSIEAATRNGKKFTFIAKALKILATPARSALNLLTNDDVLDIIERVIIRVFEKEEEAYQIINIYCWNFRTLRYLRIFNNMAIVGNLWAPVLDAADEEFSWAVSRSPQASQQYIAPIAKLFSLGVARFHQIHMSDAKVSADWLDFLMEDEAVTIIQELDGALMLFLKNFCFDMKEMMYILPYYSTIDDDILNLIDEVDIDKELKEIGEALTEVEKFPRYVREKSAAAVGKFLDYLPKMSIPIERREVGDGSGWVITCRGRNGKDLTLSNISIEKDNLLCDVLGSQNVLGLDEIKHEKLPSPPSSILDDTLAGDKDGNIEVSILDHVAELIRNAQSHGCWDIDTNGLDSSRDSFSNAPPLDGLPLSEVLHCAVDLWENLQIDDDELLEIAIREISYQIQIHKGKVDDDIEVTDQIWPEESKRIKEMRDECVQRKGLSFDVDICNTLSIESNPSTGERRFDPRKDSTVLYLSMNQLTCCLDDFTYRLEPAKPKSIFDPIFEGVGSLSIKNASMTIRVECRKERTHKLGDEITIPVLQLQELEVGMEQVNFQFKETGADWLLNKIIANFTGNITQIVRENLREQISLSINNALETLNHYIEVNPDILLKILGITIDDLEENIEFVSV